MNLTQMTPAPKTPLIAVFCGSQVGHRPIYQRVAQGMGQALVQRGFGLVYGGGAIGLMGAIADTVLAEGGEVIGVIPQFLAETEIAKSQLTQLHIVDSMHARKALMVELSVGFIAMPGGYGTLEEFCEVLTWAQLKLHDKPLGLLNVAGYYDSLLGMIDHAIAEGFIHPKLRTLIVSAPEPHPLLDLMKEDLRGDRSWSEASRRSLIDQS